MPSSPKVSLKENLQRSGGQLSVGKPGLTGHIDLHEQRFWVCTFS